MEYYDVETLDQLVAQLVAADARPSALITGIIQSAPFQRTRSPGPSGLTQTSSASDAEPQLAHLNSTHHE
jgi:hypothetical protein